MNIKFYFSVLMSFVLVYSQVSFAGSKSPTTYRGFNQNDLKVLGQINNSHQLAKTLIKNKQAHPMLVTESKKILEQKPFKLSNWKLKGQDLSFEYESNTYVIKYIKEGRYQIGSDVIDFNQNDLGFSKINFKTSKYLINYFIPEANAALPLLVWYIGAGIVAIAVVSGCLNISVTSFLGEDAVPDAKFLQNDFLTREFRNIRRKLKLDDVGCAVNAASIIDDNLDFESVVKQACGIKNQGLDPKTEFENSSEKYEFQYCLDEECTNRQGKVYFNQLDELNRNLINGFLDDEDFMRRSCSAMGEPLKPQFSHKKNYSDKSSKLKLKPRYQMGTTPAVE